MRSTLALQSMLEVAVHVFREAHGMLAGAGRRTMFDYDDRSCVLTLEKFRVEVRLLTDTVELRKANGDVETLWVAGTSAIDAGGAVISSVEEHFGRLTIGLLKQAA